MADFDPFERSLAAALRSDADERVGRFDPQAIASTAVAATQARPRRIPVGLGSMRTTNHWQVAAALVIIMLVLGGAFFVYQRNQSLLVANPSPTPVTTPSASLPAVVAPDPSPSATAPIVPGFPRAAGVWIRTGSMLAPRSGDSAAVRLLDGRVLVVGGAGDPDENDTSAEMYDPDSGTWSTTGSTAKAPYGFPATLLHDGRVLVGVLDDAASEINGAELYDPATGTWTATGQMLNKRDEMASATLLRDGRVLVAHQNGSELYDPASGTWTATARMTKRHEHHKAVLLADGRVLVAGGYVWDELGRAMPGIQESAELFDPATGTWTETASMGGPRHPINLTLLPDGKVLATGGYPGADQPLPELFDPAAGIWTPTRETASPDTLWSATLLSDGSVLVAGVFDAELYDPRTGSWTATGPVLREPDSSNASPGLTLLLDGTVLMTGRAMGTAELYVPAGLTPPPGLPTGPPPTPTATPDPTSLPPLLPPRAGPVPQGARAWTVRVVNSSATRATLFVAEEVETGVMGRLVGSVTPNVVPPRTTMEVTFLLPAKGVEGWGIFLDPRPGTSAFLWGTDVPLAGEIRIQADGSAGWLSP